MNEHARFWTRVHALLDERTDPWRDDAVLAHLDEHPEDFAELETVIRPLDALGRHPVTDGASRPWRPVLPLLALGALAAALVLILRPWNTAPENPPPAVDHPTTASRSVIFDYRIELTVENGSSRTHRILTPTEETSHVEQLDMPRDVFSYVVARSLEELR